MKEGGRGEGREGGRKGGGKENGQIITAHYIDLLTNARVIQATGTPLSRECLMTKLGLHHLGKRI